jgi:hypothetical protein
VSYLSVLLRRISKLFSIQVLPIFGYKALYVKLKAVFNIMDLTTMAAALLTNT